MRTEGVLVLVAVADFRAAFYQVRDFDHAMLQTVFDGLATFPGRIEWRDFLQSRDFLAANLIVRKNGSIHREDLHHVAHGEVQSDHLFFVFVVGELERKTRLEQRDRDLQGR